MLDAKYVLENPSLVIKRTALRGIDIELDEFMDLSEERKEYLQKVENLRSKLNKSSKLIGQKKKTGEDAAVLIGEMKILSEGIKSKEEKLREVNKKLNNIHCYHLKEV